MAEMNVGNLVAGLTMDTSGFAKGLANAADGLDNLKKNIGIAKASLISLMTNPAVLALAAVSAIGAVGKAAFDMSEEVNAAYDTIRIGTGATDEALAGLQKSFDNVFKSVPADAATVGTAIADLNTRLGLTGTELETLATQFVQLSRITESDVGTNIQNVTRLFGDWGVAAEDYESTLNSIFKVSQTTGISIDKLSTSVVQYGASLRNMGFTLEEASAMLGKFEKEGVNAETVLSSMRIALAGFSGESDEAPSVAASLASSIESLGDKAESALQKISEGKADSSVMASVSEEVQQLIKEADLAQKELARLHGVDAVSAFSGVFSDIEKLGELSTQSEYTQSTLQELINTVGNLGDGTAEAMSSLPGYAVDAREAFSQVIAEIQTLDETAGNALAMDVFGSRAGSDMAAAIREGRFEFDELMKAIEESPETIASADAATYGFAERMAELGNKVMVALTPLGSGIEVELDKAFKLLNGFADSVLPHIVSFFNFVQSLVLKIREPFEKVFARIGQSFSKFWGESEGTTGDALTVIADTVTRVVDGLATAIEWYLDTIYPAIELFLRAVVAIIKTVSALITGDWDYLWNGLLNITSTILQGITDVVFMGINAVLDFVEGAVNSIIDSINSIISGINSLTGADFGLFSRVDLNLDTPDVSRLLGLDSGANGVSVVQNITINGDVPNPSKLYQEEEKFAHTTGMGVWMA